MDMINKSATIQWFWVDECLPQEPGEYLVTYHPCYWDYVDLDRVEVGLDTFRGKSAWARRKFQRVIAWAENPYVCLRCEEIMYQRAEEDRDYCIQYEPTYNPEDGSM